MSDALTTGAVLREMRAIRPDVPIVLCSGWSADEVADSVRALPRTMFLQKPYQRQALVDANWAARQAGQLIGRRVRVTTSRSIEPDGVMIVTAVLVDR